MQKPQRRPRVALMLGWYVHAFHLGVAHYAHDANWILDASMAVTGEVPDRWHGDGIISLHAGREELIEKIRSEKLPTVDMSNPNPDLDLPTVWPDNKAIGRLAGEHLVSRGFERLGFVVHAENLPTIERRAGLAAVVAEHGRVFRTFRLGCLASELAAADLPIGLMAENDLDALSVLYECEEAGLQVPEQVAIIGVDNDELQVETASVPLSSVDSDPIGTGYAAAALLDRLMAGEPPPEEPLRIPPRGVVVRASTNILAIPHVPAARALRYIWEHYRERINLDALAGHAGMCRRRLEDAFKQHVGRSMPKEILRLRLRDAKRRLVEVDDKIYVIAADLGFSNKAHLTRVFKRELGLTPSAYRASRR